MGFFQNNNSGFILRTFWDNSPELHSFHENGNVSVFRFTERSLVPVCISRLVSDTAMVTLTKFFVISKDRLTRDTAMRGCRHIAGLQIWGS